MSEWKPIETAPLNQIILVFSEDEGVCAARGYLGYQGSGPHWAPHPASRESDDLYAVTHWKPLPAPPGA